jgi:hypothetical protein
MKYLILLFSIIYLVGCLEEEEKPKPKSKDFDAKSFVEDTQKLLGEIDNQEKKKDPFSLTKVADAAPGSAKKKFSLTPVADAGETTKTLRSGLIGWWPLDGSMNDLSNNSNHAINYGTMPTKNRWGVQNKAMYFDGKDDYIEINASKLFVTKKFSCSVFIFHNPQPDESYISIIDCDDDYPQRGIRFRLRPKHHEKSIEVVFGGLPGVNPPPFWLTAQGKAHSPQKWIFYAFTYNGEIAKFYKDSSKVAEVAVNFNPNLKRPLSLGSSGPQYGWGRGSHFHGAMDDLRIYDRELSEAEILKLNQSRD